MINQPEFKKKELYKINAKTQQLVRIGELVKDRSEGEYLAYQRAACILRTDKWINAKEDLSNVNIYLPGFYVLRGKVPVLINLPELESREVIHPAYYKYKKPSEVIGFRDIQDNMWYYDQYL